MQWAWTLSLPISYQSKVIMILSLRDTYYIDTISLVHIDVTEMNSSVNLLACVVSFNDLLYSISVPCS